MEKKTFVVEVKNILSYKNEVIKRLRDYHYLYIVEHELLYISVCVCVCVVLPCSICVMINLSCNDFYIHNFN